MTIGNNNIQEQSAQLFYKKICSYKFGNIHTKSTCLGSLFKKVTGFQAKKEALTQCFHVNIAKFLRTPILMRMAYSEYSYHY